MSEHRKLASVGNRIRDRALEQPIQWTCDRRGGRQIRVEFFDGRVESGDFTIPFLRRRTPPNLLALHHGKGPVKKIAHVSDDFYGSAGFWLDAKCSEVRWRVAQCFGPAIDRGRNSVPDHVTLGLDFSCHFDIF